MNLILAKKYIYILNKTLIFDTSKIDEEIIIDRIIEGINNKYNDEFILNINQVPVILP